MSSLFLGSVATGVLGGGMYLGSHQHEMDKNVVKGTNDLIRHIKSKRNYDLTKVSLYVRPVSGTIGLNKFLNASSSDGAGLFHGFIVIENGLDYILCERVMEGIVFRLMGEEAFKERKSWCVLYGTYETKIKTHDLAQFIENELKSKYVFLTNNCLHFAYYFRKIFLTNAKKLKGCSSNVNFKKPLDMITDVISKAKNYYRSNPQQFKKLN